MRIIVLLMVAIGLATAFSVKPDFIETKDTGNERLPLLDVTITIDCGTKDLTVQVKSNESGEAVDNAKLYLFYTQYEYQLIASSSTGSNGTGVVKVIGNRDYLTRLFILRVDRTGYRSKEIEFMYEKCFEPPPTPPPDTTNQTTAENVTPSANVTPPANVSQPSNATPPKPPEENATPPGQNAATPPVAPPVQGPCTAASLVLLSPIFLRAVL